MIAGHCSGGCPALWLRIAALFLLIAWPDASQARESRASYLQAIDSNNDGRVSESEYQAWMIRGFDYMDRNGNAVLDLEEQPAGQRRRPLSRAQRLRALSEAFHRQDSNGDGALDVAELTAPPR